MEIKTGKANKEPDTHVVPVPPDRMTARRNTVQKVQRSRNLALRLPAALKVLAKVGAVALLAAAAFFSYRYVSSSSLLTLRNISIDGCRHLDPANLESIVRQSFTADILRIDLSQLCARLEQERWIRRAEIRRILPASMKIYVQERVPSVIAEIGNELELLDSEGILLDQYNASYGKLDVPVFRGLRGDSAAAYMVFQEDNSARVRLGVQVLAELEAGSPEFTRAISELDLSDPGNVQVLLIDDSAEVSLGDRDFLKRFQAFMAEYDKVKEKYGEIISVDLRFYPQIVYRPRRSAGLGGEPGSGVVHQPK
jgi:cell division protein FtsQ